MLSTCLQFDEKTEPTYNYDYQMIETNSDGTHTADIDASLKASVSYGFIKAQLNVKVKAHKESTRKSHLHSHHPLHHSSRSHRTQLCVHISPTTSHNISALTPKLMITSGFRVYSEFRVYSSLQQQTD